MYDIIIIGAGPAGMTAGIYAARKKLKTLILSKDVGGQMVYSADVGNYSGFSLITGDDLTLKVKAHLASIKEDLEFKEREVTEVDRHVTSFAVTDRTGEIYYARSVIICSGRQPKHLGIPGETKFFGRGVAVCAACDAPLYKGRDAAVIGGGNSAMDALLSLAKTARRVYSINREASFHGDDILKTKVLARPEITFYSQSKALEILGSRQVEELRLRERSGGEKTLPVQGVFEEIGWQPSAVFDRLSKKNQAGEIMVDANLQTSVSGLFAAGDVNNSWGGQVVIAAGEGAKAAMAAADFLAKSR